ncbi:MAG: hypothetical protein FJZ88_09520 [Chloroflexi bacterium]|nr:hypothetical protein [Chloroflexota bacterium]
MEIILAIVSVIGYILLVIGILLVVGALLVAAGLLFSDHTGLAILLLVLGGVPFLLAVELYAMFGESTIKMFWGGAALAFVGGLLVQFVQSG